MRLQKLACDAAWVCDERSLCRELRWKKKSFLFKKMPSLQKEPITDRFALIPHDILAYILHFGNALLAVRLSLVSKNFFRTIETIIPRTAWKDFFLAKAGITNLCIREPFDWKHAAVYACRNTPDSILALCVWKNVCVRISSPWDGYQPSSCVGWHFDKNAIVSNPARLKRGVRRDVVQSCIDYTYNHLFHVRAVYRTCAFVPATTERDHADMMEGRRSKIDLRHFCHNCRYRSKQRCLHPRFEYFLYLVDPPRTPENTLDDHAIDRQLVTLLTG